MTDQEKVEQDIEDIKNFLNNLAYNVRRIEKALTRDVYIPRSPAQRRSLKYSHKTRQLIFDERYAMPFKKNEADLLRGLFYKTGKKAGQPMLSEFLISGIAKENARLNLSPKTHKATYLALKRINDRITKATGLFVFDITYNTIRYNEFSRFM